MFCIGFIRPDVFYNVSKCLLMVNKWINLNLTQGNE